MPVQDSPTTFVTLNEQEAALVKALASRASADTIAHSLNMQPAAVIAQLAALRQRLERIRLA